MPERPAGGELRIAALFGDIRRNLVAAGLETPDVDARLLVEHVAGITRMDMIREPDRAVPPGAVNEIEKAVARRLAGEPVHRILGWREFYGLRLALSPDTLEPRPDTESLVDLVLPSARRIMAETGECSILDLGTGTGAIALALLSVLPGARAVGADLSQGALAAAARNAEANGLSDRFRPVLSDWYRNISGRFDVIVSNPPYISQDEMAGLAPDVRAFDPELALYGGPDGLQAYRMLASGAREHINAGGLIAVEIGSRQRNAVAAIFAEQRFVLAGEARDLGGHDRALLFTV